MTTVILLTAIILVPALTLVALSIYVERYGGIPVRVTWSNR